MSAPEALILAALTMFALAAVWSIGVHEHRARRSIREFDQHTREALKLVQNVSGKRIGSYGYDGSLTISGAYVPSRPDSFTTYGKDVTS